MSTSNFINKGVEIIKKALKEDENGNYAEALKLYQNGIQYLLCSHKYDSNSKTKEVIMNKVNNYLNRAEELKKYLDNKTKTNKKEVAGGSGNQHYESDDTKNKENDKLKKSLSDAIIVEKPNVKWEDVAGLHLAKSLLKEAVIIPLKFPQLFTGKRTPWKGILLYGPPGTGKSFLAKAVATEAGNSTFFSVSSSDLVSKFLGESEKKIKALFNMARENSPSIIFIDEIDSLCGSRSDSENDSTRRIKTEILVQMQGVGNENKNVLILGATNTPWDLDSAIRRRFEKRIYIPLPDLEARLAMFKLNIGNTPNNLKDEDYMELARRTDGFSGSDISVVVRDALYGPIRTLQLSTHFKKVNDKHGDYLYVPCSAGEKNAEEKNFMDLPSEKILTLDITFNDFLRSLQNSCSSVGEKDILKHIEWTKEYGQES